MADVLDITPMPGMPPLYFGPNGSPVLNYVSAANPAPVALVADAVGALTGFDRPAYGIWQNGAPVVLAEIVNDVGYSKSYAISDFPIEEGAFQTFDKVEQPFEARIRFTSGSNIASREALIMSVEAIIGDLQTYEVVTPERVYVNANIVREEWRRVSSGSLTIEVSVQEIRLPSAASAFNPSDPASASAVNIGTVRSTAATPSQMAAAGLTPITTPANSGGIGSA